MSASTSGGGGLSPQAAAALQEGIGLVFARWTALQMAVENEWGGRDSRAKADRLAADVLSFFTTSKGAHSCVPFSTLLRLRLRSSTNSSSLQRGSAFLGPVTASIQSFHGLSQPDMSIP
uniref:Pre-rRNA-processing protein TSR2 n=1 Tax=Aegilops tauschii subsp. strangulata TaxID=200361 RepID=A0A453GZT6_AEGTS